MAMKIWECGHKSYYVLQTASEADEMNVILVVT